MVKLFVGALAVNKWVICSQSKANAFLKAHNVMNLPWMRHIKFVFYMLIDMIENSRSPTTAHTCSLTLCGNVKMSSSYV